MDINKNLDFNINIFDEIYKDCGDIVGRKFPVFKNSGISAYVICIDNMANRDVVDLAIMRGLMVDIRLTTPYSGFDDTVIYDTLKNNGIITSDMSEADSIDAINDAILAGNTALLIDGFSKAIIISTKGFPGRGVQNADTEVVVQGSKEAFSEGMRVNTALIRKRIKDTNLKVYQTIVGEKTKSDVAVMYLKGVVREEILNDVLQRIDKISIDAVLDSGQVEQLIEDDWVSPFPQVQSTERPDKAASAILEGRIVIIVDNSPFVLIVPATMNVFFQSSEDYYGRWEIMSFIRAIRYLAGIMALLLPALYVAITLYHPSMIPLFLSFKIAGERSAVPFSVVGELIIMEIAFEMLKEAGIRLPGPIGGTMGIVGGIIIGSAAVEAGLITPIVVIIVALTEVASFAIPHVSLVAGVRLVKYLILVFAACFGFLGFWIGLLLVMIHMVNLKSFTVPYMFPYVAGDVNNFNDMKDSIFRLPMFMMKRKPIFANPNPTLKHGMQSESRNRISDVLSDSKPRF